MATGGIPQEEKTYVSLNSRAKWVIWLFIAFIILYITAVISGFLQADLLNRLINDGVVSETEIIATDNRESIISLLRIVLFTAATIAFLVWVHRAHKNLPALRADDLKFTPGWAVGWFFVPIMNLARPFQAVSEIYKASNPDVSIADSKSWKEAETPGVVVLWWALFLISNVLGQIVTRMWLNDTTINELLTSTYAYIVSDLVDIFGIIVTIQMVRIITYFQKTKYELISSGVQK